jgi:transcriptional regulator
VYVPPSFELADPALALEIVASNPFGLLITCEEGVPYVSHLPLIAQSREDRLSVVGHVARANPHARAILERLPATVVFGGPHAYVSASWYERPYETVPTWNYAAVHVCGRLRESDPWQAVCALAEVMEGSRPGAWDPQRLDSGYRDAQLRGIVAFSLEADALYAKAKLSQNRSRTDRLRVVRQLLASGDQSARECGELMRRSDELV